MAEPKKIAIIIGAGPAGLTAAYELVTKTDIKPIVIEASDSVGGIAKTINKSGWLFDIGPHRFFSKDSRVTDIWESLLPLQGSLSQEDLDLNRNIILSKKINAPDPEKTDKVMLYKNRLTRIYHKHKLFDYPIKLTLPNLSKIGLLKVITILKDYFIIKIKPIKPENSLEDFFINRFGRTLYTTFFKDYTEKVWGVSCQKIPKSWGVQRVKRLSIAKILSEAIKKTISPNHKTKETSLIDNFLYPKLGSGQIYEEMAEIIKQKGGVIKLNSTAKQITIVQQQAVTLKISNNKDNSTEDLSGNYFFSSLAIKNLINIIDNPPADIKLIANGLRYRDFILVSLVYNQLNLKNKTKIKTKNELIPDNWIYIQEPGIKMGRLNIFNNFSPWLLKDTNKVLLGAEYFCDENDELWNMSDEDLIDLGEKELVKMDIASEYNFLEGFVYRQKKAYPAYLGTYNKFNEIKDYLDSIKNFFSIGRNGQHRYNNMDHSMLTAIYAVQNIINGEKNKNNIWDVNTEEEYHEQK